MQSERSRSMMKKYTAGTLLTLGVIFIVDFVSFKPILNGISRALVYEDPLVKAEAILVLSGSGSGNRIKVASKLYHEGFGAKLIFSGYQLYPGTYTSDLMKQYALKLGIPENKIIVEIAAGEASTRGESIANIKLLKKNNIRKFILVTSAYHTRRAKLIYERAASLLGYDIEFLVHPAPDPSVPIEGWWEIRTGQKGVFLEYVKSVAYYF